MLQGALLVNAAVGKLAEFLAGQVPDAKPSDVLRAAENILDRFGLPRRHELSAEMGREALLGRIAELQSSQQAES